MAQQLVGYNADGTIKPFPLSGSTSSGVNMTDLYFLNFARLLGKDEIQKGTFYMDLGVGSQYATQATFSSRRIRVKDASGSTTFRTDSPAGEYGLLYASASATVLSQDETMPVCGLIYYQAGVVVLTSSLFQDGSYLMDMYGNPNMLYYTKNALLQRQRELAKISYDNMMKYVEKIGLIKFDFLGLKTLTVINKTQKIIKKKK